MARQSRDQHSAGYPLNQQNPPQGAAWPTPSGGTGAPFPVAQPFPTLPPARRPEKTGLDVSRESSYDSRLNQRSLNMQEFNEDVAGYIAARVLGEDSKPPSSRCTQ